MNKIIFLCFGAFIFFTTRKVESKFENIKNFLLNFDLSEISEQKRQFTGKSVSIENAEKSIELKAFGKTFVIDLSVYYPEEDVSVVYISSGSPSTSSFLDSHLLIYYGSVRDVKGSFAVGSFDTRNLFRGYIVTDDVYCVEPHLEENATVIVYKMRDVIYPGCTQSGEELDCTETNFYAPWIPDNPQMKNFHNYHWFFLKYQQLLNKLQSMKTNFKELSNGDNSHEQYRNSDTYDTEYHKDEPKTWSSDKNKKSFLHKRARDDIKGQPDEGNSHDYITHNNITNHFRNEIDFRSLINPYEDSKLENISKFAISKGQENAMDSIFEKFSYSESRGVWKEISPTPIEKMSLELGKDILDTVNIAR